MIFLITTLQDLPPGLLIFCDCNELVVRDGEGNYDCKNPKCGLSW